MTNGTWRIYSDAPKQNVCVAPVNYKPLQVYGISEMEYRVSQDNEEGIDPREICIKTIDRLNREANGHKMCASLELSDEESHVLSRVECIKLRNAIEKLVHVYDNGIHQRQWPV